VARFDLYRARSGTGLLLDVQSGFLDHLKTCVVVPLVPPHSVPAPIRDLHPVFTIEGERHLLATQFLAAIPKRELGALAGNLEVERDAITRALGLLFSGF